jgi:hypothetical protein
MNATLKVAANTAANNFEAVSKMVGDDLRGGAALARTALGLTQLARVIRDALSDVIARAMAETAAGNFEAVSRMPGDVLRRGDGLARIALGLMQLSRAVKGL